MTNRGGSKTPKDPNDTESEIDFMILAADNVEALRQAVRILLATVRDLSLLLSTLRSEVDSLRHDMTRLQGKLDESANSIEREVVSRTSREWGLLRMGLIIIVIVLIAEGVLSWVAIMSR